MDATAAIAAPTALFRRIEASFLRQGLMQHLGARLLRVEPGLCEVALPYSERVTQQQGGFHGGAMGALADIAGGYAALTVAAEDAEVTTVEYKINFMAGFKDGELRALGRVAKAGKRIIVTTAEVTHVAAGGKESACALMQQTLVPVPKTY
ncbi:MAG: PaaI family thioesterase [Bacteroidia bacterium]|nr:PaaI family thioesterase [Polaromonas sp.]MCZ8285197.1 PaaI family thioesterase [Bacteroidia bacterium]